MEGECFMCGARFEHDADGETGGGIFSNDLREGGKGVCNKCHSEAVK